MNLKDLKIPGFSLHTAEQKADIASKSVSRLENAVFTRPDVFDAPLQRLQELFADQYRHRTHLHRQIGMKGST